MFGYFVLEACTFLIRDKIAVYPEGREGGEEPGGVEIIIRMYYMKNQSIFNKRKKNINKLEGNKNKS